MNKVRYISILSVVLAGCLLAGGLLYGLGFLRPLSQVPAAHSTPAQQTAAAPPGTLATQEGVVALVNDQPITQEEWHRAAALNQVMSQVTGKEFFDAETTLESLVNQRLVLQAMAAAGKVVTATESQASERLAFLQQNWGIDGNRLEQVLSAAQLSETDLIQETRRMLAVEQGLRSISATQTPEDWLVARRSASRISILAGQLSAQAPTPPTRQVSSQPTPPVPPGSSAPPTPAPQAIVENGVTPGQLAPDFSLQDLEGRPVSNSQFETRENRCNYPKSDPGCGLPQ